MECCYSWWSPSVLQICSQQIPPGCFLRLFVPSSSFLLVKCFHLLFSFLFYVHECLPACKYVPRVHVWCLQTPEEGIACAEIGFRWVWSAVWVLGPEPGPPEEHSALTCCTVHLVPSCCHSVEVYTEIKPPALGRWNVTYTLLAFCMSWCTCLFTPLISQDGFSALYMSVYNVLFKSFAWSKVVRLLELEINDMCFLIYDLFNRFLSFLRNAISYSNLVLISCSGQLFLQQEGVC